MASDAQRARQRRWVREARKRTPLETTVEQAAVEELEGRGFPCVKFGRDGWPDRLVLLGLGRHLWLEFKREKFSSLTPAQRRRIPRLREAGDRVEVVRSVIQAVQAVEYERRRR